MIAHIYTQSIVKETARTPFKMAVDDLDNLEYFIKFPNSNFNYTNQQHNNGENDFVFVVNEEKIPVILLFGWAGCQDKYLAKYAQIYEEKGWVLNFTFFFISIKSRKSNNYQVQDDCVKFDANKVAPIIFSFKY